jgi:hypothetical protein
MVRLDWWCEGLGGLACNDGPRAEELLVMQLEIVAWSMAHFRGCKDYRERGNTTKMVEMQRSDPLVTVKGHARLGRPSTTTSTNTSSPPTISGLGREAREVALRHGCEWDWSRAAPAKTQVAACLSTWGIDKTPSLAFLLTSACITFLCPLLRHSLYDAVQGNTTLPTFPPPPPHCSPPSLNLSLGLGTSPLPVLLLLPRTPTPPKVPANTTLLPPLHHPRLRHPRRHRLRRRRPPIRRPRPRRNVPVRLARHAR